MAKQPEQPPINIGFVPPDDAAEGHSSAPMTPKLTTAQWMEIVQRIARSDAKILKALADR